ncbi:MAG: hypothetical protein OXG91_09550 [bacterium]|nr:hypothetical protein [bacterium]
MATSPPPDLILEPLTGKPRAVEEWVTTFHLVVVALDPFTHESGWILPTAGRVMGNFSGADCRVGWLVCGTDDQAREFLGPWADRFLTFADPDRAMAQGLGLERLPAIVHLNHSLEVVGAAEGWNPRAWRTVANGLAEAMSWSKPRIPTRDDPSPYAGTPATG